MANKRQHVIGLVANRALREGPSSPLIRLVRALEPYLREVLQPQIHAVEGTYRALLRYGLLQDYPHLYCLPAGRQGGLVALADRVVQGASSDEQPIDEVIYLIDPRDATSMFPDSLALKRECVVTETTFLASYHAAAEWYGLSWCATRRAKGTPHPSATRHFVSHELLQRLLPEAATGLQAQTLALIAHDTRKGAMLRFAEAHFDLIARFGGRLATGTTGALLNGERPGRLAEVWDDLEAEAQAFKQLGHVPARLRAAQASNAETEAARARLAERLDGHHWVAAQPSGPKGGDVRIAEAVLRDACHKVIFFEDPHVSREHEADIQLLERTTRIPEHDVMLLHDPGSASRWAQAWERCLEAGWTSPVTVSEAFQRLWGVELVLADINGKKPTRAQKPGRLWRAVLERGAWYLHGLVAHRAEQRRGSSVAARVGVTWGYEAHQLTATLSELPEWLADANAKPKLTHPVAAPQFLRPGNVRVAPLVGIMGTTDPRNEANQSAARLARHFGGEAGSLPQYAFCDATLSQSTGICGDDSGGGSWDDLDALVLTCDPVRPQLGAGATLPTALYAQMEGQAVGEVCGIFLEADGTELEPQYFPRVGISAEQLRNAAASGASVLLCGADPDRVRPALAALHAGFASVLVTDLDFAWRILETVAGERT